MMVIEFILAWKLSCGVLHWPHSKPIMASIRFCLSFMSLVMTELTLVSRQSRPLRPLVEAALANELRLIQAAIRQSEERLRIFEETYDMTTTDFVARFEDDELEETLDLVEWIGEYRLLIHLQYKAETYQGIEIDN